jgi:hypothetical protein
MKMRCDDQGFTGALPEAAGQARRRMERSGHRSRRAVVCMRSALLLSLPHRWYQQYQR